MPQESSETEWAADRKVGFAMGILLIAVVAALFFRNEAADLDDVPGVDREALIDSRLRARDVTVYTEDADSPDDVREPQWTMRELLAEYDQRNSVAMPIGAAETCEGPEEPLVSNPDTPSFQAPADNPESVPADSVPADSAAPPKDDSLVMEPRFDTDSEFEEYTIQYGDTLSGIAERMLGSPARYVEIYEANEDRMTSPDRLSVGAAIRIPVR